MIVRCADSWGMERSQDEMEGRDKSGGAGRRVETTCSHLSVTWRCRAKGTEEALQDRDLLSLPSSLFTSGQALSDGQPTCFISLLFLSCCRGGCHCWLSNCLPPWKKVGV